MTRFMRRFLDPAECMSELLFGLVMSLTFTLGASLVIQEGPDATRELLVGVLGCNIAWGIIDGFLYIFNAMYSRGMPNRAAHLLARKGRDAAVEAVNAHVEDSFGDALTPSTRDAVRRDVLRRLEQHKPARVGLTGDDLGGAIASGILVILTAAPALLPFLIFDNHMLALRVSNGIMIFLLYIIGVRWAAAIDANRQRIGLGLAVGGLLIVQLTIMLGG